MKSLSYPLGQPATDEERTVVQVEGRARRPLLTTFGPGLTLRFASRVLLPEIGVLLGLAVNPVRVGGDGVDYADPGPGFLVGPIVRGGLGIRLGGSPLAIRLLAEGGELVPFPTVRALVMLSGGK